MRRSISIILILLLLLAGCASTVTDMSTPPKSSPAATEGGSPTFSIESDPTDQEGSSVVTADRVLFPGGSIKSIQVESLPGGYYYHFTGEDVDAILDYISGLHLITDFTENPDEYVGMSWHISINYENGATWEIYHFGNMFIRSTADPWYKMDYEEASYFATLLYELAKDAP